MADSLARPLAGHFVMGGALGALLALSLFATDATLFEMIAHSAAPGSTAIVFVGVFTAICGVGATLTGWIFLAMEDG